MMVTTLTRFCAVSAQIHFCIFVFVIIYIQRYTRYEAESWMTDNERVNSGYLQNIIQPSAFVEQVGNSTSLYTFSISCLSSTHIDFPWKSTIDDILVESVQNEELQCENNYYISNTFHRKSISNFQEQIKFYDGLPTCIMFFLQQIFLFYFWTAIIFENRTMFWATCIIFYLITTSLIWEERTYSSFVNIFGIIIFGVQHEIFRLKLNFRYNLHWLYSVFIKTYCACCLILIAASFFYIDIFFKFYMTMEIIVLVLALILNLFMMHVVLCVPAVKLNVELGCSTVQTSSFVIDEELENPEKEKNADENS